MRWRRLALAVPLWLIAVLLLGLWPRNPGWRPDPQGVAIAVGGTGVHADLVLPVRAAGVDLSGMLRDAGLPDAPWIAVGWGERDFYLHTPTWADASLGRTLRAGLGSEETLVQVSRLGGPDGVLLRLSPEQYRRLAAEVVASVKRPVERLPGYTADDVFLGSQGRYSGLLTCNQWVADRLAAAGVRVGSFVPLAWGLRQSLGDGEVLGAG